MTPKLCLDCAQPIIPQMIYHAYGIIEPRRMAPTRKWCNNCRIKHRRDHQAQWKKEKRQREQDNKNPT